MRRSPSTNQNIQNSVRGVKEQPIIVQNNRQTPSTSSTCVYLCAPRTSVLQGPIRTSKTGFGVKVSKTQANQEIFCPEEKRKQQHKNIINHYLFVQKVRNGSSFLFCLFSRSTCIRMIARRRLVSDGNSSNFLFS